VKVSALSLPPPGAKPGWGAVAPVLGLALLAGLAFGLRHALSALRKDDVFAALAATPVAGLWHAAGWLAAAFVIMMIYDLPGALYAQRLAGCPAIAPWRIALTSFCAYALSHLLGAPAFTAAAIRLRLYAQAGVPAAGIARILALSGSLFSTGFVTLAGLVLVVFPAALPDFAQRLPSLDLRLAGLALLALGVAYVFPLQRLALSQLGKWRFTLPGSRLAALQVAIGCADTLIAAAILFAVLPAAPALGFVRVLAVYLAAFAGGLLSGLPAGVGVFDALLLLGLSGHIDPAQGLGALLLFRGLYFLLPAVLAAAAFTVLEGLAALRSAPGLAKK
jgi:uncharacterized membrane protein YbhN (UPF0104 family)